MHVVPIGEAGHNVTVVNEAKQLGTKYGDFLHYLTLLLLYQLRHPRIRGSLVAGGGGDGQHAKSMVQATTHIFHSRSKAMSTSVGVLKAKAVLSGPRVQSCTRTRQACSTLAQNTWGWTLQRGQGACCQVAADRVLFLPCTDVFHPAEACWKQAWTPPDRRLHSCRDRTLISPQGTPFHTSAFRQGSFSDQE